VGVKTLIDGTSTVEGRGSREPAPLMIGSWPEDLQCATTVKKSRLHAARNAPGMPFCPGTTGTGAGGP